MSSHCKSKSIIRSFSSFSNSRSHTQEARQIQNQKDWVQIWQGINSIAKKIKQISSLHQSASVNDRSRKKRVAETRTAHHHLRIQTSADYSTSLAKKYYSKCLKSERKNHGSIKKKNTSVKDYQRSKELAKTKSIQSLNREISEVKTKAIENSQNTFKKNTPCQTQCHIVMEEMQKLKQINLGLLKKNNYLEQRLNASVKKQQESNKRRQKAILVTAKSIKQREKQNENIETYGIQNIYERRKQLVGKHLKERDHLNSRYNKNEISINDIQAKQVNLQRPLEFSQKQNRKILNLSKEKKKVMEENQRNKQIAKKIQQKKSKPSQLTTLEQQFDKLVELSYKQKNKGKKHALWGEMKEMANKLKIMRQFIEVE